MPLAMCHAGQPAFYHKLRVRLLLRLLLLLLLLYREVVPLLSLHVIVPACCCRC
jgi:hypothetical protein